MIKPVNKISITGLLFFMLISVPVSAANVPGFVFAYECKQIDPNELGFSCALESAETGDVLHIHHTKDVKAMPKDEYEHSKYRYLSLILRFFELGGKHFKVTSNYWEDEKFCVRSRDSKFSYVCS